ELTKHKDDLMTEIVADKNEILMEFEREAQRLIEMIREEEFKLFQNLNETQQAIINRIQLVVASYDTDMENIKNSKIAELEAIIHGYDTLIENAKQLAVDAVSEVGDAYIIDLTTTKDNYVTILTNLKNQFSTELTAQHSKHSSDLTTQYNKHSSDLTGQASGSSSDLLKDYQTHSANLLKEKNEYNQILVNTKAASVNEITNLKDSAMNEIGRDQNKGLWKTVRDSIIKTGNDEKTELTTEGNRILTLFENIESNFSKVVDEAVARIGTSDSTGLRGEAIKSITALKNSSELRIGTSDTSMDGSNPSLRKSAIDAINAIKTEGVNVLTSHKNSVISAADIEMNREKDEVIGIINGVSANVESQADASLTEIIAERNSSLSDIQKKHAETNT
ncbi:MAG: hypothetical protein ACRCZ9_04360, partial [Fusobacteriaceae bacterium]